MVCYIRATSFGHLSSCERTYAFSLIGPCNSWHWK